MQCTSTIATTLAVFTFCLTATLISASPSRVINLETNRRNFDNNKCGVPKPVLFYLGEEEETRDFHEATLDPPVVLVNRCTKITGCCANGGSCVVETEEKVVFMVSVNGLELSATIGNHTSCKCVEETSTFDSESDSDKGNCNDELRAFLIVALTCGVISFLLSLLNGFASFTLLRRFKTYQQ